MENELNRNDKSRMNSNLESLWILDKTGLCYVQRVFDKNTITLDENKLSGLLTAILMFSQDVFEESFEKLTMGGKEIFIKSFEKITMAIAVKRESKSKEEDNEIFNLLDEIGQAFLIEYADVINSTNLIDLEQFQYFGAIIDQICGIETFIYLNEHDQLIKILMNAEDKGYEEETAIKEVLNFLDNLSDYKLNIIIQTTSEILSPILENASLKSDQKKRYKKLLK